MAGSSTYPTTVDDFAAASPTNLGDLDTSGRRHGDRHDDIEAAMIAVQTELGANPSGASATVAARFTALDSTIAGLGGGGGLQGWYNVQDYGAVGDGTTDDTTAINAAITAAGIGGTVYFPPHAWGGGTSGASYRVSSTLKPLRSQRWIGCHVPQYDSDEYFLSRCVIRALSSFTGSSLLAFDSALPNVDVSFENLAFQGRGESHGTLMDGAHGGSNASSTERNWQFDNCQFSAFSGAAFAGHMLAWDISRTWVMRCAYGVRPNAATAACIDWKMAHSVIAWNINGGIVLSSTLQSGGVTLSDLRVERNGVTPNTSAQTNRNTNAPGIQLGNARHVQMSQIYTDGNSGPGLDIQPIGGGNVYNVIGDSLLFIRDGGGDLAGTDTMNIPGVNIYSVRNIHLNLAVELGDPDDSGGVAGTGKYPYYGVKLDYAYNSTIHASRVYIEVPSRRFNISNNNPGLHVYHAESGRMGVAVKRSSKTADYTIAISDVGKVLEHNSATGHTFTLPQNDESNGTINNRFFWPDGAQIDLLNQGTGDLTIAAGTGVTINSKNGWLKLDGQYSAATLINRGTNVWDLVGALKA